MPVLAGEDEIYARPVIGVAVFPGHGDSEVTLLQHARMASRLARNRAERVVVYAEAHQTPEIELLRAESLLRGAIVTETLDLLFQPQIEFRTGLISGVETLLRLDGAGRDIVSARAALETAQSAGLANELTGRILNSAMRSCADFRDAAGLNLRFGVNLTANSLRQPGLPDVVSRALDTWNLRPGRLVIEVNQTAMLEASPEAGKALQRLKEIGTRLSIDDPDAGFASLAYLATLPFDEMKIDLSRVPDMLSAPKQDSLVQSLIELAHRIRLEVVAEGVDSEAVAARIKEHGCDYMQGRHVSPPLDAAGVIRDFGR
jgi:EAL domain-containing protein (putative c-di-GMP-specific phosphodiesterase class I)